MSQECEFDCDPSGPDSNIHAPRCPIALEARIADLDWRLKEERIIVRGLKTERNLVPVIDGHDGRQEELRQVAKILESDGTHLAIKRDLLSVIYRMAQSAWGSWVLAREADKTRKLYKETALQLVSAQDEIASFREHLFVGGLNIYAWRERAENFATGYLAGKCQCWQEKRYLDRAHSEHCPEMNARLARGYCDEIKKLKADLTLKNEIVEAGKRVYYNAGIHPAAWISGDEHEYTERSPSMNEWNERVTRLFKAYAALDATPARESREETTRPGCPRCGGAWAAWATVCRFCRYGA